MATPLYEIVGMRTEVAKHWRNDDGSYTAKISSAPIHYQDENSTWQNLYTDIIDPVAIAIPKQPINKTLHGNGGWAHSQHFTTPYNKADIRLPKNIKSGYAIGFGPDRLTFTPVNASPSLGQVNPTVPNEIDYQDTWVDTDVTLIVKPDGVKETIILKSNNSPTTFSFKVDGPLASDFTSGALKILAPWYEDANGTRKDATMTQRSTGGVTYVDISIDPTGLTYPITLDPTTTLNGTNVTQSGCVSSQYPTQAYQFSTVGYDGTSIWISYIQFDLSSIPAGSATSSAAFSAYAYTVISGAVNNVFDVKQVTSSWTSGQIQGVTWNTKPSDTTTNKATYTVTSTTKETYSWDVSAIVANWFSGATNFGFSISGENTTSGTPEVQFYNATQSPAPSLSVTYTQPPGAPTVTAPNGGESINTTFNITWTAATDPDTAQSALTYQIDLSEDNGSTWTTIVSQTAAGATSYNYDFTNTAASSTCLIRIRAYDGTSYGPYDQSNGVFTIKHDTAPTAPTNLSPANNTPMDRTQAINATWIFNDPDVGDAQSKFNIKWSTNNGSTWTEVDGTVSATSVYQWAANTFADGATVDWMVQTYDQSGLNSPWSSQAQFTTHNPTPAPTITSPANNATVATANPTIQWSASGQAGYEIQVRGTNGVSLYDEQHSTSTNNAQTLTGYNLANNTSYEIALRIVASDGLWSPWAVNNITVSYTPPAQTMVTATPDNTNARITLAITNPAPTGSQPTVDHNDLYRRKTGSTSWTRIATGLVNDAAYEDYAVASNQQYDYKVTAVGTNSTSTDSSVVSSSIGLTELWLHDVTNPSGTSLALQYNTARSEHWTPDSTTLKFAGRSRPVVVFGEQEEYTVKVGITLTTAQNNWLTLSNLARNKDILCVRDDRGRKVFAVITSLPETDQTYGQTVDIEFTEVDYTEAV